MTTETFKTAALASIANGERLTEDANLLLESERSPSAYALAILAQEEFAKALLLSLVDAGALPWSPDVRQALRDHICKHLASAVLDFLCPDTDEFLRRYGKLRPEGDPWRLPDSIVDAVHVMVHERIPRGRRDDWLDPDGTLDSEVRAVSKGSVDRQKQNALYVGVGSNGAVYSEPKNITEQDARRELERAQRFGSDLRPFNGVPGPRTGIEMQRLILLFKVLTRAIAIEEFRAQWR